MDKVENHLEYGKREGWYADSAMYVDILNLLGGDAKRAVTGEQIMWEDLVVSCLKYYLFIYGPDTSLRSHFNHRDSASPICTQEGMSVHMSSTLTLVTHQYSQSCHLQQEIELSDSECGELQSLTCFLVYVQV